MRLVRLLRYSASTGVAALLLTASVASAQAARRPDIDRIFAQYDRPGSPGCQLLVGQNGRVLYERGYGSANLDEDIPIGPETVFNIGSISKQFTAASIVLLLEQGKLSLDDPIQKYLPELPTYSAPVTIGELIHHTSGIRDNLTLIALSGSNLDDFQPPERQLRLIARQKELNFAPGSEFLYSNSGYFLLALIAQRASGQSLHDFAEANIFRPLGMRTSHFHDDARMIIKHRAIGYAENGTGGFTIDYSLNYDRIGAGGVNTTARDLFRWEEAFYTNRIGGADFWPTMHTRGVLTNGDTIPYAFGLTHGTYRGAKVVEHGGSSMGFRAQLTRFPDLHTAIITLCNLGNAHPGELSERVADVVLAKQLHGEIPTAHPQPPRPKPALPADVRLEDYAGRYYSPELDVTYTVALGEKGLTVKVAEEAAVPMTFSAADTFSAPIGGRLQFQRDAAHRVTGFLVQAGRVRNLRFDRSE